MPSCSRGLKWPAGGRSYLPHSRSIDSGIQESGGRSQRSQQYSNEQDLSYRTKRGNSQELDGAAFHRRQDESPRVWQQIANLFDAEQRLHDLLPWNPQSQSMAPGTNKLEIQGNSSRQDRLHHVEDMSEFLESNASYPDPHLQNQQGFEYGSQDPRMGLDVPLFPDPTTADNPIPNLRYSCDLDVMPPTHATQAPEFSEKANIQSFLEDISEMGTIANAEPWSPYKRNGTSHVSNEFNTNQEAYPNEISDISLSTFEPNHSDFSHQPTDDWCTRISSYDMNDNTVDHSRVTERPGSLEYSVAYEPMPCSSFSESIPSGPVVVLRHPTPPDDRPHNAIYTSVLDTASSEFDRTAPLDAISDASSPPAPPEIQCDAAGCGIVFSGTYRAGNLARHKRLKHRGPRPYICAHPSCDRVFQRQDARLKHYRKWHAELASPYLARPQSRYASREQYSDLASSVSG